MAPHLLDAAVIIKTNWENFSPSTIINSWNRSKCLNRLNTVDEVVMRKNLDTDEQANKEKEKTKKGIDDISKEMSSVQENKKDGKKQKKTT